MRRHSRRQEEPVATATLVGDHRGKAGRTVDDHTAGARLAPAGARTARPLAAPPGEALAAGRALAESINRQLVVPVSVLELLAAHTAMPADLRPMLAAARDALRHTAAQAEQLQVVVQRPA
jgi:hypothetical protein